MTAEAIADRFRNKTLQSRMVKLWYKVVRERGQIIRYRDKLFQLWKQWAPQQKKLSTLYNNTVHWLRMKRITRSFSVMTSLCYEIIGKRSVALKQLRSNFCDRKIVICAYALLSKDSHVLMVDCWRKLVHYWQCRRKWKAFRWHYNYQWHFHKAKSEC